MVLWNVWFYIFINLWHLFRIAHCPFVPFLKNTWPWVPGGAKTRTKGMRNVGDKSLKRRHRKRGEEKDYKNVVFTENLFSKRIGNCHTEDAHTESHTHTLTLKHQRAHTSKFFYLFGFRFFRSSSSLRHFFSVKRFVLFFFHFAVSIFEDMATE